MSAPALQARVQAAFSNLGQGRIVEADAMARSLLAEFPGNPDVQCLAGELACAQGRDAEAVPHFRHAIASMPAMWPLRLRLAELLLFLRRRTEAHREVDAALATAGDDVAALWESGRTLRKCLDYPAARDCFARAAALAPAEPRLWFDLAACEFFLGNADAAEAAIVRLLELPASSPELQGQALYLRATLRRQSVENNHLADLEQRLVGLTTPKARAPALYAVAKEREDTGDHAGSFEALEQAVRLRSDTLQPDVSGELETMSAIRRAWTPGAFRAATATGGCDEAGAIFVVGLPRTGTTLTERILLRDPRVVAAGELPDLPQLVYLHAREALDADAASMTEASTRLDFAALGAEYMRSAREAAGGASRFIDKLPVNFQYLGIIAAAMPAARIVHVRRDPMDAAYAIHKTLFAMAYPWSCDLRQVADYVIACHQLMVHWQALMPDRIVEIGYEELVQAPDLHAGRLLAACGLEANASGGNEVDSGRVVATASASQVRQPIHAASVGAWRRHAGVLEPVRRRFQDAGLH